MYENPYNVPKWKKYWRRFSYWFRSGGFIGFLLIGLVTLLIWIGYIQAKEEEKEYNTFMHECVKDHKEYECNLMWKQAKPKKETHFIYLPK